jgi:hypothetical protein
MRELHCPRCDEATCVADPGVHTTVMSVITLPL